LKTFSLFILLIYWSFIILAPVVSNETLYKENEKVIFPLKKPVD